MKTATRSYSFGRGSRTPPEMDQRQRVATWQAHRARFIEPRCYTGLCQACWGTGAAWPYTTLGEMPDWTGEPTGPCPHCEGTGEKSAVGSPAPATEP